MNTPSISVIMPVYNSGKFLKEAIDSILTQDFRDFEFIILNDGSTDNSKEIIQSYTDERIRFIDSDQNEGLVYQLNKGLSIAKGKYIARMDSDDISVKGRFGIQFRFMEKNPDIGISGCYNIVFGNINRIWTMPLTDEEIRIELIFGSPFSHNCVFIRKDIIDLHELRYRKDAFPTEDIDMWVRLMEYAKGANLPEPLTYYRIHGAQVTTEKRNVIDEKHYSICKNYFENKFFKLQDDDVFNYHLFLDKEILDIRNNSSFKAFLRKCKSNHKLKMSDRQLSNNFDRVYFKRILKSRSLLLMVLFFFDSGFFQRLRIFFDALKISLMHKIGNSKTLLSV